MLLKSVQQNHVAHAQLFLGQEGGANLALALAYATYINCENRQPADSCGTCGRGGMSTATAWRPSPGQRWRDC